MNLIPGNLYKFPYINGHTRDLNRKLVMYIGEDHIHRGDGVVIENFRIQVIGEDRIRLCDNRMRYHIKELSWDGDVYVNHHLGEWPSK